ncbi:hypothetical protein CYLTODRAFT_377362 [Cylindrobasidium torrendii FP15055 ss-10]|uniref:RRM domain-containing protein n=1 Tax=Cylindrobasidium torrendii FP15055 ss-10 TaxID=1314674 RepID=A0A0D7B9B6_9AGAR|nr:hypothetical protein CYLTODRAFT_377362 [Cylindrobasidium torrendii FP15055 ss-10]
MNVVREINKINEAELKMGISGSWHDEYKESAYVFVGGLNTELTEGDVITIMSQFGEIANINLPRHKDTGAPRGFAFVMYLDQRSTVLAVDNLNGAQVVGRTLRVDHVKDYKQGRVKNDEGEWEDKDAEDMNAMPEVAGAAAESDDTDEDDGIDPEDPMADYLRAQKRAENKTDKKKKKHEGETKEERKARKAAKKEKKAKKGKASDGMRAVEALLAGWDSRGTRKRSRERSDSPDSRRMDTRSPSPRRRRLDDTPPRRRRDDSRDRSRRRDDSPGGRHTSSRRTPPRDITPPLRRDRDDTPPARGSPPPRRDRSPRRDGRRIDDAPVALKRV